jgi:hypothetical protein
MHRRNEWAAATEWAEWVYILRVDVRRVWAGVPCDSEVEVSTREFKYFKECVVAHDVEYIGIVLIKLFILVWTVVFNLIYVF